jgi:hypothetical protein
MKKLFLSAVAAMLAVTAFSQKIIINVKEYNSKDSSIFTNSVTQKNGIQTDSDWTFDLDNYKLYYKHNSNPIMNQSGTEKEILGVKEKNGIFTITYLDQDINIKTIQYTNIAIIDTNKKTIVLKRNEQQRGLIVFNVATKLKMTINKQS